MPHFFLILTQNDIKALFATIGIRLGRTKLARKQRQRIIRPSHTILDIFLACPSKIVLDN